MSVPNRSNDSHVPSDSSAHDTPTGGGIGAFAAAYRARWAMSHPNMRRQWPADIGPLPLAPSGAAAQEPIPALSAPGRDRPNGRDGE